MNFNLKRFQRKYSNDLTFGIKNLLEDQNIKNKVCIFQSPTGSGKTLMLANTIYNLIKDIDSMEEKQKRAYVRLYEKVGEEIGLNFMDKLNYVD